MGAQQAGEGSSPPQASHASLSKAAKRRNTVHSTPLDPLWTTLPSLAVPANHTPTQPLRVPLYSPLWQLTQLNHFNHHAFIHGSVPLVAPMQPGGPIRVGPTSRANSPHKRGRRRARSPETRAAHDDGPESKPRTLEQARPAIMPSPNSATRPPRRTEPFPLLPTRPPTRHQPSPSSSPSSLSHHSNSVPTTPHQRPRQLSLHSASGSPHEDAGHSPRSVHSESNSHLPPLRKPPTGCRFETAMAFPRRRMPYSLGGDPLEKVRTGVKPSLRPDEEKQLSGDMRELYDRLLPSAESEERRVRFVQKVETLLNDQWPGNDIKVRVFGSSGNLLCTSDSDVDICVVTPLKELEHVCVLAKVLAEHGMERVVCVSTAKVPIVKMWDPELQLACDLNVNNTLALENTRMIKTYVEIDPRVRPLAMVIKHWTKMRVLNEAAFGGTLSSYTWICMILNFLQTREPPILPCLHQRPHQKRALIDGVESSFADDLDTLRGYGQPNQQTLGELLFQFFRYHAHEFDYERDVISVRRGKLISKEGKGWHLMQNNRICVEEPFNVNRNLGNTADDASFRGLHLEMRRAFSLIADEVNLTASCEPYTFPPEEERIWDRPPPQPRPILSRSSSQSGRGRRGGAGASRGGRHAGHQSLRLPGSARRASSSATVGHANGIMPTYPLLGPSVQDYYRQTQAQLKLRDQLYESYQALQAQEHELRLIQAQARTVSQVQARNETSMRRSTLGPVTYLNTSLGGVTSSLDAAPHTAPLRPDMFFYPLQYVSAQPYYPQGTSTNPPSPLMTPVLPELRRSTQRAQVADANANGSLRSHSQPARSVPSPLRSHAVPASVAPAHGIMKAPPNDARQGNPVDDAEFADDRVSSDLGHGSSMAGLSHGDGTPKEYVGYYVGGSPPSQRQDDDLILRPVPYFGDLSHASGMMASEQSAMESLQRLRLRSRSPGSWDRAGAVVNSPRSAPLRAMGPPATGSYGMEPAPERRGPLIVDGSISTPGPEAARSHQMSVSESTSTSDDQSYQTLDTTFDGHHQEALEMMRNGSYQPPLYTPSFSDPSPYVEHGRPQVVSSTNGQTPATRIVVSSSERSATLQASPSSAATGLGIVMINDGSGSASALRSAQVPNGVYQMATEGVPSMNGAKSGIDEPSPNMQAVAPVLSPVLETSSPSPATKKKKFDYFPDGRPGQMNGVVREGRVKEPQPPPTPASGMSRTSTQQTDGPMQKSDVLTQKSDGQLQNKSEVLMQKPNGHVTDHPGSGSMVNGWQQTVSKHKRGSKSGSKKVVGMKAQAETMPANESDRKGG